MKPLLSFLLLPLILSVFRVHADTVIDLPFSQAKNGVPAVRGYFPPESKPFTVWQGRVNVWPKNKTAIGKNELAEVAFGRGIRVKESDHKKEKSLGIGLEAKDGYLAVRAGWRVHKEITRADDEYDGTLFGKARVSVEGGKVTAKVSVDDFHWNAGWGVRFVPPLALLKEFSEPFVAKKLEEKLGNNLRQAIEAQLDRLVKDKPELAPYRSRLNVSILEDTIRVTIRH
jgi:hypothetical protein